MVKFVPQLINLFATLILLLAFAMISQRRIVSLINLFMLHNNTPFNRSKTSRNP